MGVTKKLISEGDGTTKPQKGDTITMEYTVKSRRNNNWQARVTD